MLVFLLLGKVGRKRVHPRDCRALPPPGQQSVWAPPGDPALDSRARKRWGLSLRLHSLFHCAGLPARAGVRRQHVSRGAERSGSSARPGRPLLGVVNPAVLGGSCPAGGSSSLLSVSSRPA